MNDIDAIRQTIAYLRDQESKEARKHMSVYTDIRMHTLCVRPFDRLREMRVAIEAAIDREVIANE